MPVQTTSEGEKDQTRTPSPYPLAGPVIKTSPPEWVAADEALPFSPESSPALVPVVISLSARFGIFASGALGSRQKEIRIRTYLEGALWNPYNRPIRLHNRTGLQPVCQALIGGLPALRIHNRSQGISTGWLEPDASTNSQGGAPGLHGWIRLPPLLAPGEIYYLQEPDSKSQPEGLARTLHPGFAVGPGDSVDIEFEKTPHSLMAALVDLSESDPLKAAQQGRSWFKALGKAPVPGPIRFARADAGERPFYLAEGSLAFRREQCQLLAGFVRGESTWDGLLDPRRQELPFGETLMDASGNAISVEDLIEVVLETPPRSFPEDQATRAQTPLFAWPDKPTPEFPATLDWMDMVEGQRMGAPGATLLNRWLAASACFLRGPPVLQLQMVSGSSVGYLPALPVNSLDMGAWARLLGQRAGTPSNPGSTSGYYPAFGTTSSNRPGDFAPGPKPGLAAQRLVAELIKEPAHSVEDFFNKGYLAKAMRPESPFLAARLSPLRGWLDPASLPVNHPGAWVLHLTVLAREQHRSVECRARIWLLQTSPPDQPVRLEVMRLEWPPLANPSGLPTPAGQPENSDRKTTPTGRRRSVPETEHQRR